MCHELGMKWVRQTMAKRWKTVCCGGHHRVLWELKEEGEGVWEKGTSGTQCPEGIGSWFWSPYLLVTLDQSFNLSASQFPICKMEIALPVLSIEQLAIFADHIETEYRNAFST